MDSNFVPYDHTHEIKPLLLVGIIVNQGQTNDISAMLRDRGCAIMVSSFGLGTSTTNVMASIGINGLKKTVIFGIIKSEVWESLRKDLEARFSLSPLSKGVAFVSPIDAVPAVSLYKMLSNTKVYEKPLKTWRKKQ